MARNQKHYDTDYKVQSVNLAKEIGLSKAARELGISTSTLNGWIKATREGRLITAPGSQTPNGAMTLLLLCCSAPSRKHPTCLARMQKNGRRGNSLCTEIKNSIEILSVNEKGMTLSGNHV